jgi:hypothetical protein
MMNKVLKSKNAHLLVCCVRCVCIIINYKNYHEGFYPQHHIKLYHSNCHLFEYIDIVVIEYCIFSSSRWSLSNCILMIWLWFMIYSYYFISCSLFYYISFYVLCLKVVKYLLLNMNIINNIPK